MSLTDVYITWGLLALLLLAIGSVARSVDHAREEIEELRQYMTGEKNEDPDSLG